MHPPHIAKNGLRRRAQLYIGLPIGIEEAAVDSVRMGGDEVDGGAGLLHVVQKFRDPGGSGIRGSADAQLGIDDFSVRAVSS